MENLQVDVSAFELTANLIRRVVWRAFSQEQIWEMEDDRVLFCEVALEQVQDNPYLLLA